jgi:hypothetical protein
MKWGLEVNWALVRNHSPSPRSKVWGKISKAWKRMVEKLDFSPPQVVEAIKRVSIWWGSNFNTLEFGLSILRVQKLYKFGLHTLRDPWRVETIYFHSWDEVKILFPLEEGDILVPTMAN